MDEEKEERTEKRMEARHAKWMKAHGAPAKMVQEELSEDYACGGKVKKKKKVKKFAEGGLASLDDNEVRSNLPTKNATEQQWERKRATKKDSNPKLTKQYAKDKSVAETIYGGNAEKALRNGWQYENGEKNHHKRGKPVNTNDIGAKRYKADMEKLGYSKGGVVRGTGCAIKGKGFRMR